MKKRILSAFILGIGSLAGALEITAEFPIVAVSEANGVPEEKAPIILQEHLGKIFGKDVSVIPASQWQDGSPAIILRRDPNLDNEEWNIESDGKVLTISGGSPRGVFYGACEFLEKFGGVRWFTTHEVKIPAKDVLIVPDNRAFRRKPAFPLKRHISTSLSYSDYERSRACLKLTGVTPWGWPSLFNTRRISLGHNYWKLTGAVPQGMERMLPVDKNGNPQRGHSALGPGQVCFSNPEFREFAKKEIAKWVAEEEKFIEDRGLPKEYKAKWIVLSQNDKYDDFCCCEGCKALIRKYGSISGAQLEFINDIASAFPDYMIMTFAYQLTQNPPQNIRARDNVVMHLAFLSFIDLLRPISHPNNAEAREMYEGWYNVAGKLAIYAYHRLYPISEAFPWPQCCYWNIAENMRYYYNLGAVKLYLESEFWYRHCYPSRAFNDLHNYLECKMMDDPMQDDKPIIEEFFQYQYGPAVEEMKAYADLLKKRIDAVPGIVSEKPIKMRGIMDADFFKTVNELFAGAEAKAGEDRGLLTRIAMERIPVDFAAINMWDQGGAACGISRSEVIDRLEKNIKLFFDRYQPEKQRKHQNITLADYEKETFDMLNLMRNPLPIPPEFAKEDVIQIPVYGTLSARTLTDDPDAAYGKAIKLGKVNNPEYDHTKYPMMFGIYDSTENKAVLERTIRSEEIPQDEKTYRLYYLGRHVPNGLHKEQLWGHRSWQLRIEYLYKNKLWDPIDDVREYDIYISCKLTGPAYVKGSTKENAVYVDKLLAVKRGIRTESRTESGTK